MTIKMLNYLNLLASSENKIYKLLDFSILYYLRGTKIQTYFKYFLSRLS